MHFLQEQEQEHETAWLSLMQTKTKTKHKKAIEKPVLVISGLLEPINQISGNQEKCENDYISPDKKSFFTFLIIIIFGRFHHRLRCEPTIQ